jgi:hypothetical protein
MRVFPGAVVLQFVNIFHLWRQYCGVHLAKGVSRRSLIVIVHFVSLICSLNLL